MPNWCQNFVQIKGQNLKALKELIGDGTNLLSRFYPTPQALVETTSPFNGTEEERAKLVKEYGSDDWYSWNCDHWGTKWDVEVEAPQFLDDQINLYFDSAWAPPLQAMRKLSTLFPDVTIRHSYLEVGMCFVGVAEISNGEVNDNYNEDPDSEEWKKMAADEFGWEGWEYDDEEDDVSV